MSAEILLYVLLVFFIVLFIIVACKWKNEVHHRIAMEEEYDTLLERSIMICDELSKVEELVVTQNKIINELQNKL